jgi:hypothetical protein
MTVSELISYLNKFCPNAVVRAVDSNGRSTSYVLIRDLADNSVEITGLPEPGSYYSDEYGDRYSMPGPCNGDFLEGLK